MKLKHYVKLFTLLTLGSVVGCKTPVKQDQNKVDQPNIVFFIADDMYPEMFNCLPEGEGKNITPNMDRLAKEGTLMVNQYVASPVCTPSRYNCLTGRYASRATNRTFKNFTKLQDGQTVIQWNTFITTNDTALPHKMRDLGYTTGMVGKSHVIEVDSLYHFPDYWADAKDTKNREMVSYNYHRTLDAVRENGFDFAEAIYYDNPNFVGLGELAVQNMDWIAEAGVKFIQQNTDHPFFLYFATTIPHHPQEPERSWNANPLITANGYLEKAPDVMPARHTLPERTKAAGLQGKNKENLLWLDDALGALIHTLEVQGILDNTIIFFFNDHGQKAKGALYQGGIMSPSLIWKKGGFPCGNLCKTKVQNIDFAPTIVEMAGGSPESSDFDGVSFQSALNGEKEQDRSLFFELGYARAIVKGDYKYYAVRYPEYGEHRTKAERAEVLKAYNAPRLIKKMGVVNLDDPMAPYSHFSMIPGGQQAEHESYGKVPAYFNKDQLYNIKEDPNELNDLMNSDDHQQIYKSLKAELQSHLDNKPGKFNL